jgi:hypothetical protein
MADENQVGFLERIGAQLMLGKLFGAIDGYKTYLIAGISIVVVLAGHFWGPFPLAGGIVPKESWNDVWAAVQASGIIAALRHGISKGATQ